MEVSSVFATIRYSGPSKLWLDSPEPQINENGIKSELDKELNTFNIPFTYLSYIQLTACQTIQNCQTSPVDF
jgi:hypothetical protein